MQSTKSEAPVAPDAEPSHEHHTVSQVEAIVIGTLVELPIVENESPCALVSYGYKNRRYSKQAVITQSLDKVRVGTQVALTFVGGDISRPVVLGPVYSPLAEMLDASMAGQSNGDAKQERFAGGNDQEPQKEPINAPVTVDGRQVLIEGSEEIVLKCGDASITLTRSGKIMIRGQYVLNRASGVNRILGGSVQVN